MAVPEISRFFGIVINMYFDDHAPPHFHARYAEFEAQVQIDPAEILTGALPRRAFSLVADWARIHQAALFENWRRAQAREELFRIPPLE